MKPYDEEGLDLEDLEAYCKFVIENPFHQFAPLKELPRRAKTIPSEEDIQRELEQRDSYLERKREHSIFEEDYEFDPERFMTDRLIPKGQILKAIRDSCIHE